MQTIQQVISILLPHGSNPIFELDFGRRQMKVHQKSTTRKVPQWPADLFAVAAVLIELSGSYSSNRYGAKSKTNYSFFDQRYRKRVIAEGRKWRNSTYPTKYVQSLWSILLKHQNRKLSEKIDNVRDATFELLAIADEACKGVAGNDQVKGSKMASVYQFRHVLLQQFKVPEALSTICTAVPHEVVCVQPKTMTSQVGCTIRSLSHHLALLPSCNQVQTDWRAFGNHVFKRSDTKLNILAIPFPFRIEENSFESMGLINNAQGNSGHFQMRQTWLPEEDRSEKVFNFILDMLEEANENGEQIHGILLPELALDEQTAIEVSEALAMWTDLQFFVTGICRASKKTGKPTKNQAFTAFFSDKSAMFQVYQSKHHRWKLDRGQIERYRIGDRLNSSTEWWENIDIEDRRLSFFTIRPGTVMSTLVCEDLARIDPVQPVVRSIGPNLVVALLQDGPQLLKRWPGRYATVLSEDPGSSVLTLTSLGMLERSMEVGDHRSSRIIALWKDSKLGALELDIPRNCHGLIINLKMSKSKNMTLDGRTHTKAASVVSLIGTRSIKLEKLPSWIRSW